MFRRTIHSLTGCLLGASEESLIISSFLIIYEVIENRKQAVEPSFFCVCFFGAVISTTEHIVSSLQGLCCTKCQVVLAVWNNSGVCTGAQGAKQRRAQKEKNESRSGKQPSPLCCAGRLCGSPRRALNLPHTAGLGPASGRRRYFWLIQ